MIGGDSPGPDPRLRDVLLLAAGLGGLAMSLALLFLGMRSVMDIGGACASGGGYVPAQPCPEASTPALFLGVIAGLGFGALALVAGGRVGGTWPGVVLLVGWSGLFASLGWNFLDYGLVHPPETERVVWGWIIPGVLFEAMAIAPILVVLSAARDGRGGDRLRAAALELTRGKVAGRDAESDPGMPAPPGTLAAVGSRDATEATNELLEHLERLAELRDRGLLGRDDYEAAKAAVVRELDGSS